MIPYLALTVGLGAGFIAGLLVGCLARISKQADSDADLIRAQALICERCRDEIDHEYARKFADFVKGEGFN